MSRRARALIAGCGDVGTALGLRLAARGREVWGLRRRPEGLPEEIRPLAADLADPATLSALPPDLDEVVYAAAAGAPTDEAYRAAYVDGVANLLAALAAHGQRPRRLVFVSSTGVYAQTGGAWVDETSPAEPVHVTGRRLLEGERLAAGGPSPAVVVRFAGIYGPGRTRLVDSVRAGTAVCPEGPPVWTNRIHRDDCAGMLEHLLDLADPAPLYVGVDSEPADLCAVLSWLAERLGAPPPRPGAAADGDRRGGNKRCSNARLLASGYRFLYPTFREGYGAMLGG